MTDLVESPAAAPGPASDSSSAHPSAPTREAASRPLVVGAWLLAASAVVCILVYLGVSVQGGWFTNARSQHWLPSQMIVSRGSGQLRADALQLNAPDAGGTTVVSVTSALRSSQYPVIAWQVTGIPDGVEVALLWHNDYAPSRVFNRRLNVEGGRIQPFSLDGDPNWNGTINGLALGLKGAYTQPILIKGATAKTMSTREILGDRVREWLTFEPWSGSSINLIIGGADTQDLPMPFIFAAIVGLAALIYAALARWRPRWLGGTAAIVIGAMFVIGWFVLDARLQWNLLRQARVTAETYAGKSWRDRHLAAEDGMVFAFIEKVRALLPPPPARVFMVADEHYFRDRAAYHLYPYNVFFSPWANTMPPSSALRSGDYLVVFQRRGVQFDPAQQNLRWEGQAPVRAELLLVEGGAAMFRGALMQTIMAVVSVLLPWLLGIAVLLALGWPSDDRGGEYRDRDALPWLLRIGFGYVIGAVLATAWLRVLSLAGIPFGRTAAALPVLAMAAALAFWGLRAKRWSLPDMPAARAAFALPALERWQRLLWIALIAWIALRFILVAAEIAWRPLYPWDAWVQWATKARVWYELGRIVPFGGPDQWLAGTPGLYFDAAPGYYGTVPLLQVWTCVMIGRWDDSAMNWPWLAMLCSLTVAIYAVLRAEKVAPLAALIGAYIVASLPLLDVHAALAGYADLPQAAVYTLAALATYRWALRRDRLDAIVALMLACACPMIKNPGVIWAPTLIPAVVVTLLPRRGLRILCIGAALAALVAIVLARTQWSVLGYALRLDFTPAWRELVRTYFLMGNWNLLWYGLIALWIVSARRLFKPPLLPLAVTIVSGLAFLFIVFSISEAALWMADLTTANRATLHLAPLLIAFGVLTWNQWNGTAPAPPPPETNRPEFAAGGA